MMVRDICVIPIISLTSRRMRCSGRNDLFVGCDFPVECDGLKGRSKSTRGVRPRPRPGSKEPPRRAVPSCRRERGRSRRPDGDAPLRPRHPAVRRRRRGCRIGRGCYHPPPFQEPYVHLSAHTARAFHYPAKGRRHKRVALVSFPWYRLI